MQSQQKRVKWSRGETAEALEERTDTGITIASVELMENCIPDIFGNISRRPAIKPIPLSSSFVAPAGTPYIGFTQASVPGESVLPADANDRDKANQFVPFYITDDDIILVGVNCGTYIRIKNGEIVSQYNAGVGDYLIINGRKDVYSGKLIIPKVSYAQQNNYLIISTDRTIYKVQFILAANNIDFTPQVSVFVFSAGWYAPNGTQTKQVSSSDVTGLSFDSSSVGNYVYTDISGSTTVYSWIKTGLSSSGISATWSATTTTYYVVSDSLIVSTQPSTYKTSFTMTNNNSYANDTVLATFTVQVGMLSYNCKVYFRVRNDNAFFEIVRGATFNPPREPYTYDVSGQVSISLPAIFDIIPPGSIVQFPNNGAYMRVEGYDSDGTNLRMYGSLLTPIANNNVTDTIVNIEYGYQSLMPTSYSSPGNNLFPHPLKLCFNEQRLWAASWATSFTEFYPIVIGSQIARYDDFSNNYNQANEPITLDILTKFKETIVHLVDYNGLKVFTDCYEYAYVDGGIVKQSANGALEQCEPIIFDSLCVYADSTGSQVRAMQYELQSNIFNSSCINQLSAHDLVWYPTYLASYEDKVNNTGKYLFVTNSQVNNNSILGVCNFVPSNQANIWNRWTFPQLNIDFGGETGVVSSSLIHSVINTKTKPIFMMRCAVVADAHPIKEVKWSGFVPCYLDFDGNLDLQGTVSQDGKVIINTVEKSSIDWYQTLPNAEVAIYSNGEYQFTKTTNEYGIISDDLSELTNVTVGFTINSIIRSHPIDVGGKTKSVMKRIGKVQMSTRDTAAGAITINGKTGYMNPRIDHICFYGVTGMKDEIKYTITNKNGAMFHLESLLMNIEYGTLDS